MIINLKYFPYAAQPRIGPKYGIVFDALERHRNAFEIRVADSSPTNLHIWRTRFPKYLQLSQKECKLLPVQILNLGSSLFLVVAFSFFNVRSQYLSFAHSCTQPVSTTNNEIEKKYLRQKPISSAVFQSRKRTRFLVMKKNKFEAPHKHLGFMVAKQLPYSGLKNVP